MGFWAFGVVIYIAVFIVAFTMTYREQQLSNVKSPVFCLIGYVLCMVWPLTVVLVLGAIGHGALTRKLSHS